MYELLGPAFVKGVYAIFKGKPNQAFIVVVVITNIVLAFWVINANNPDDRTYGVIAIIFVFLATLSRIVHILAQGNLRGIPEDEEVADEEEPPLPPDPSLVQPVAHARDTLPPQIRPPVI